MLEKGSEIGAHILSGAVLEPRALDELIPDWQETRRAAEHAGRRGPLPVPDRDAVATSCRRRRRCTTTATTSSAWAICAAGWASRPRRWASRSIPGFAAAEVLYHEDGSVKGVATGDMGIGKDGQHDRQLPARHGAARQADDLRRRLPRLADQDAVRALQPARRRRPADLRHRHQGTVGDPTRPSTSQGWSSTPSAGR